MAGFEPSINGPGFEVSTEAAQQPSRGDVSPDVTRCHPARQRRPSSASVATLQCSAEPAAQALQLLVRLQDALRHTPIDCLALSELFVVEWAKHPIAHVSNDYLDTAENHVGTAEPLECVNDHLCFRFVLICRSAGGQQALDIFFVQNAQHCSERYRRHGIPVRKTVTISPAFRPLWSTTTVRSSRPAMLGR
jgi:hypothetical protein